LNDSVNIALTYLAEEEPWIARERTKGFSKK
jgi:hypothetical protein